MQKIAPKTIFVTVIITLIIITGTAVTARTTPRLAPAIWITPETLNFETATASVGDRFNVTLWMSTIVPSFTWQIRVNFDTFELRAIRAGYTAGDQSLFFYGHETIPVTPVIDNARGNVIHGESQIGTDSAPAGSDSLFWIEFQIAAEPSRERLTSLISIDQGADTVILDPNLNFITGFNFGNAVYTFTRFGRFKIGNQIETMTSVIVRDGPGISYAMTGIVSEWTYGNIVGGPVEADMCIWWNISFDTGVTGWSTDNWLQLARPVIWITPETLSFETATASVGDKFNVTVWIRTIGISFTWVVKVNFNTSQLKAVRAGYTSGDHSTFFEGHSTIPFYNVIDNAAGFAIDAESLLGADSVTAKNSSLFWIEFQIALAPSRARVPLTSLISTDQGYDTFVLDPDLNVIEGSDFRIMNAVYTYAVQPAPIEWTFVMFTDPHSAVVLTDPHGQSIGKSVNEILEATYAEVDLDGDGDLDKFILIPDLIDGNYVITLNGTDVGYYSMMVQFVTWREVFSFNATEILISSGTVHQYTIDWAALSQSEECVTVQIDSYSDDLLDHTFTSDRELTQSEYMTVLCDANLDGKVDMSDIALAAQAFGTSHGDVRWNPQSDIIADNRVDLRDIGQIARYFGKSVH